MTIAPVGRTTLTFRTVARELINSITKSYLARLENIRVQCEKTYTDVAECKSRYRLTMS